MNREWVKQVRTNVDRTLNAFFEGKRTRARAVTPQSVELVDLVGNFTTQGGKRLRPVVLFAGYRTLRGAQDIPCLLKAAAALELLQSYLLIHDDWMDRDELRRGQPAVHAALRDRVGDAHLGASLAVLAGDLASTYAWELLTSIEIDPSAYRRALKLFHEIQEEVVFGQQLDLLGEGDMQLLHDLKTGSYTVRGPLCLGALLASATDAQLDALCMFAIPVGQAFQLRDDLLGVFGNVKAQGKPVGNDLKAGKHTMVVDDAKANLDGADQALFNSVFANPHASTNDVNTLVEVLVKRGVRERCERRLIDVTEQATAALTHPDLRTLDTHWLSELIDLLTKRED